MASQTLWDGYFQSFGYFVAFKFKMDDVHHVEDRSSGAKNSTYNALVSFSPSLASEIHQNVY